MVIGQTSFRIIFAEIDHLQIFVFSSWAYFLSQNFKKVNLCKRKYLKIIFRILILSTFLWRRLKALSTIQSSSYLSEWITPRPPCHRSVPPRYLTKVQSLWPDWWLLETSSEGSLVVPQIDPSVPQPVVQSRRRPLLGPSPGWNRLLALSHLRHYAKRALTHCLSTWNWVRDAIIIRDWRL